MIEWQTFILEHAWRMRAHHLAAIVGVPEAEIHALRQRVSPKPPVSTTRTFAELFALWRGRPPRDEEWPAPRKVGGGYEWLGPELALLASLVGTVSVISICETLTNRLRQLTGDPAAARGRWHVQAAINRIGLQSGVDLVGGLTTNEAAKRVGRLAVVNQAINNGQLRTFRVGRRHVIPREEFERWLSTRGEPPTGWVRLASIREPLGISSDGKLPEYAALGYIPDVVLVNGIGTARGVWYIAPERARQILDAARAGRKLPWHGQPLPINQHTMWRKWQRRKHRACRRCRAIWRGAAPTTFEAFCARYAQLSLGEKRHLTLDRRRRRTRPWRPWGTARAHRAAGLTVYEAARHLQQPTKWIRRWIRRGLFDLGGLARDPLGGEAVRITAVGMAMLRGVADGEAAARDDREWVGVHLAAQIAGVCITTAHRWRADGEVVTKRGPRGLLFERASLEERARAYWAWALKRYRRAAPPARLAEAAA